MRIKELIQEYVKDHFDHFGFYPYDVVVDEEVYRYHEYMKILHGIDLWERCLTTQAPNMRTSIKRF